MTDDERKALAEIEAMLLDPPVRTYREIGAILGLAPQTVQNYERRALAKLRRYATRGEQ